MEVCTENDLILSEKKTLDLRGRVLLSISLSYLRVTFSYVIDRNQMSSSPFSQVSILSVCAMSFLNGKDIYMIYVLYYITASDIAYVENLLNLSIAAAYPICFLAMSGEMKRCSVKWQPLIRKVYSKSKKSGKRRKIQDSRKKIDAACQLSCVESGQQSQMNVRLEIPFDKASLFYYVCTCLKNCEVLQFDKKNKHSS